MFLSRFKISAAAVLLFAATNFAQNVLSNGNMEYGDGGYRTVIERLEKQDSAPAPQDEEEK